MAEWKQGVKLRHHPSLTEVSIMFGGIDQFRQSKLVFAELHSAMDAVIPMPNKCKTTSVISIP